MQNCWRNKKKAFNHLHETLILSQKTNFKYDDVYSIGKQEADKKEKERARNFHYNLGG